MISLSENFENYIEIVSLSHCLHLNIKSPLFSCWTQRMNEETINYGNDIVIKKQCCTQNSSQYESKFKFLKIFPLNFMFATSCSFKHGQLICLLLNFRYCFLSTRMLFTSIEGHAHAANGTFLVFLVHMAFVRLNSGGMIHTTSVNK